LRDKVEDIASTILALSEQTKQIGEITAVVNNIAQQSKMLALNASIEATKAGEAGKGFSVVAAEVRSLAEQSEESTGQIQKILLNIQNATDKAVMATEEGSKKAEEGVGLIESTGAVIGNLSEVIDEASVASQQIVAAVQQEAIGIDQASTGMVEINNVIQQFVSTSEQIGASVDRLGEELTSQSASKG
jgi:methyl-accepting chemotaxis protein